MKNFYKYAALIVGGALSLWACSSSDDDDVKKSGLTPIDQPQVVVSDLTTSSFSLRWNAIDGAASYAIQFEDVDEVTTEECSVSFQGLELQKEYVVAIKTLPKFKDEYSESPYVYIHVLTDDLEQLPKPEATLGCAYASKTLISWNQVPETSLYEYTINGETHTTSERTTTLSKLEKGKEYTFSLRALTADATRFTNSEPVELTFTTSTDDIPAIIVAPTLVISDAVEFQIFTTADVTYYYNVIPAALFYKYTPEEIVAVYRQTIIDYAKEQEVSFQLAMASLLKSGTKTIQLTGLTSQLTYVAFAFGIDFDGNLQEDISYAEFKTTTDGYSAGPNFGYSDWFSQSFFITNAFAIQGTNVTNSVCTTWQGQSVASIRYMIVTTSSFDKVFPDYTDTASIIALLKDDNYGTLLPDDRLSIVNATSLTLVTGVNSGTSYTLMTLVTSATGEESLHVNSVTTKTGTASNTWFIAYPLVDEYYGPTHNTFACVMRGVYTSSVRYVIFKTSALAQFPISSYPTIVDTYGHDLPEEYLEYVNDNGFAILAGGEGSNIEPETSYTFIATAKNIAGDSLTKYGSAITTAAPTGTASVAATTRSAGDLVPIYGYPIASPEKFIFPFQSTPLPDGVRPQGDLWTIIHNQQILK